MEVVRKLQLEGSLEIDQAEFSGQEAAFQAERILYISAPRRAGGTLSDWRKKLIELALGGPAVKTSAGVPGCVRRAPGGGGTALCFSHLKESRSPSNDRFGQICVS